VRALFFGRVLRLTLVGFGLLLLAACEADATIEIDVADDGSGLVTIGVGLDEEATASTLDFEEQLPIEDLVETGWVVAPPAIEPDGLTWVRAQKPFSRPDQLGPLMTEIAGEGGPFENFELIRTRSFARTQWEFSGEVDFRDGLESFTDPALVRELEGQPFGRSEEALRTEAGGSLERLIDVLFVVDLPGGVVEANDDDRAPVGLGDEGDEADDDDAPAVGGTTTTVLATTTSEPDVDSAQAKAYDGLVWRPSLERRDRLELMARTEDVQLVAVIWRWVAAGAALALVGTVGYGGLRYVLDRRADEIERQRRPAHSVTEPEARPRATPSPLGSERLGSSTGPLQVVVLDALGVLFTSRDLLDDVVIPFVRDKGSGAARREIVNRLDEAVLGRITTAEFWDAIGLSAAPAKLDEQMMARLRASDGVDLFLRSAKNRELSIAALGDLPEEWAEALNRRADLNGFLDSVVTSASVGARPPEAPIFEAVENVTGVSPARSMLISHRVADLDRAKALGFRTALFTERVDDIITDHPILRNFDL